VIGEQTTEAELNELLASPAGAAQRLEEHRARSEAYIDAALS
jgi:hypothetical protein